MRPNTIRHFLIHVFNAASTLRLITLWLLLINTGSVFASSVIDTDFSNKQSIEQRLAAAVAEEKSLSPDADPVLRERLQELEAICRYHLSSLDILNKTRTLRDSETKALADWSAPVLKDPYTLLQWDDARRQYTELRKALDVSQVQLRLVKNELDAAQYKLDQQQKSTRRTSEFGNALSVTVDQVLTRIAAENAGRLSVRVQTLEAEITMVQAKVDLHKRNVDAIAINVTFSQNELDSILDRVARDHSNALAAEQNIARRNVNDPLLSWRLEFLKLEESFWKARFAAHQATDTAQRKIQLAALKELKTKVDDWVTVGNLRSQGDIIHSHLINANELDQAVKLTTELQQRFVFAFEELESRQHNISLIDITKNQLTSIWQTELYLVEETEIVDGKKVVVYRAVTVGKIVSLLLILIIGIVGLRILVAWSKRKFLTRKWMSPTTAESVAKLVFFSGLVLLIVFGLNTARIPLTALAFLGGALAIGFGFGTQTILKNFMSGIILMLERPLSIGDVVQVAGITGTIKNIGIRASLIQHFDGIETLVPNSVLIENELTNWNLSDPRLRHSVLVGVDYGSPTREISKILLGVADEHGLVLKDPAPEVRFEDFGSDALMFRLLFWIDTRKSGGREQVASDLRFMIDRSFSEHGITIAYPQRDVHLHTTAPLPIEVINRKAD